MRASRFLLSSILEFILKKLSSTEYKDVEKFADFTGPIVAVVVMGGAAGGTFVSAMFFDQMGISYFSKWILSVAVGAVTGLILLIVITFSVGTVVRLAVLSNRKIQDFSGKSRVTRKGKT